MIKPIRILCLLSAGLLLFASCAGEGPEQQRLPLDLYVDPAVSAEDPGSGTFPSIESARDYIRLLDKNDYGGITVHIAEGRYRTDGIVFEECDSGTESCRIAYQADGEAVLSGGFLFGPDDLSKVTDEETRSRLAETARDEIYCADLKKLGITAEDVGGLYTIGTFNTASCYDGDYIGGQACELFFNGQRMTLARYPNEGYLKTSRVILEGENQYTEGFKSRNPRGDTYRIGSSLISHLSRWKTLDGVWMYGYWYYDWAEASTPIGEFNEKDKTLTTKFVSVYGAKEGAPYYFYNVLEELDIPGEWYLDRNDLMLYLYPTADITSSMIELTLTDSSIIAMNGVSYVTLDGLTVEETRETGLTLTGNRNIIKNCLFRNIGAWAASVEGYDNLITACEATRTGQGGFLISGGNTETLEPGGNIVENTYVHDWSEIYLTYQPAVSLNGVGNIARHNEFCNSPHMAVYFTGNDHLIEYNDIHDVCLQSLDAGALYAGRSWFQYGTVIRYNYFHGLGNGAYEPTGLYLDDAESGITVHGNIFADIPGVGLLVGGGRDNVVTNNVLINTRFCYDKRARDEMLSDGWFKNAAADEDMWQNLLASPWQSDVWKEAYPELAGCHHDDGNPDDYYYIVNPAAVVRNNVFAAVTNRWGDNANTYGCLVPEGLTEFENNVEYSLEDFRGMFADPDGPDFDLHMLSDAKVYGDIPDFEPIPVDEIGLLVPVRGAE